MLKKETISLLNLNTANFRDIFSICIGKTYIVQKRLINFLGNYGNWNTNIKEGILKLGDRNFEVEYIGTTSKSDDYWASAEIEDMIPDQYVDLMVRTREFMESLNIKDLTEGKVLMHDNIDGFNLSMIYTAFAPEDVACFCGSGYTSIYMFVKKLPRDIFGKVSLVEFPNYIMEIISKFDVNHKLMLKALLIENEISYIDNEKYIIIKFDDYSSLMVTFDDQERIKNISNYN